MKTVMRPLTARESEHCAKLLWRAGETLLSQVLGVKESTLRAWLKKDRWPEQQIQRVLALTLDAVPKKVAKPRFKPPKASRLQVSLTRSECLYYRED